MTGRGRYTFQSVFLATAFAIVFAPIGVSRVVARQAAPASTPSLTLDEQETFLKKAKVLRTRGASKGVTGTLRATLSDGTITHDASIQTIDQSIREFRSNRGVELNFVDSWRYNVAAYRIDRVLELGMIPPSVERSYNGKTGSFTWWVDDVLMDEGERLKQKKPAPEINRWNEQMWHVRMFDQLIANVDRNLGNLVIDKNWTVWMIDHSRAFRLADKVKAPATLSKVDRQVFERLKTLNEETLKTAVEDYLTRPELRALLARRDEIVALFEKAGPTALYDRSWRTVP